MTNFIISSNHDFPPSKFISKQNKYKIVENNEKWIPTMAKQSLDTEIKGSELGHRWCENKWKYEKWRTKEKHIRTKTTKKSQKLPWPRSDPSVAQRATPNVQHPMSNAQRPTPNVQHPTPNA